MTFPLYGQSYYSYTNEQLKIESNYLKDSINCKLQLPETFKYSSKTTKYPVIIIFDSQHEKTYPHIVNSIDLLTNESQMPESIIVGIPFNRYNRTYLTSNDKKKNDSLAGIKRTELFLFKELIPLLKEKYKANDFLVIVGHSRTAFLANYLMYEQSENIDVTVSLSGFYSNKPLTVKKMEDFFLDSSNFPNKLKYYFTAGTTSEEKTYLKEFNTMSTFLASSTISENLVWKFEQTENSNHMTNYWLSVPPILINIFADYNKILNSWFETKLKDNSLKKPLSVFKNDLLETSKKMNFEVNPSITQIFSISSDYAYQKKEYKTAIDFILYGKKYYSNYYDFDESLAELYKELGDKDKEIYWRESYENGKANEK